MWLSRYSAALILGFLPGAVYAAACPVDADGNMVNGWPTNRTPGASFTLGYEASAGGTYCGQPPTNQRNTSATGSASTYEAIAALSDTKKTTSGLGTPTFETSCVIFPYGGQPAWWREVRYFRIDRPPPNDGYPWRFVQFIDNTTLPGDCEPPPPPPPACATRKGWLTQVVTENIVATTNAYQGTCWNGCVVESSKPQSHGVDCDSTGACSYLISITTAAQVCGAEPDPVPAPEPEPDPLPSVNPPTSEGEVCVTSAAGTEACVSDAYGENCGYINDKYVCLGKTDNDECWINSDGSRYCGTAAPTPPVPDNGTPGVKATPNDTLGSPSPATAGNTYNYYNSATVANSARDAGTSGNNPNRPGSTNPSTTPTPVTVVGGTLDGTGDGNGDGEDPGQIAGYSDCAFAGDPTACPTFADALQAFYNGLEQTPIAAAWTGIGSTVPAGACPSAEISVFGSSYSLTDTMCNIWDNYVVPVISLVFLFVWPFIGLRVIMSA